MAVNPHNKGKGHILLLPYLAKGHQQPLIALAHRLAERTGFQITIVSTPLNVQYIRQSLPADTAIAFAELPFVGADHGLPPGVENTNSAPPHLILNILKASATLQPAFEELVADITRRDGRPPVAIVSDFLLAWSVQVARRFGSLHYSFLVICAIGILRLIYAASAGETVDAPESDVMSRVYFCSRESDAVVVNTVEELEQEALQQLRKMDWKRLSTVGPLLWPPPPSASSSSPSPSPELQWLDRHPPGSVLYISFGSEVRVHPRQIMDLAKGLETSGKAFIWVIRPPIGVDAVEEEGLEEVEWLPEGFCRRVKESDRGLLLTKWAPQVEILSHESVGAFLSHCGWNAVLEGLSKGVPIIGWPLAYEQPDTFKYLKEELGVAVELAVGVGARFCASDVERAIGGAMGDDSEKGAKVRRKSKEVKEIITNASMRGESFKGSSVAAMDEFIQQLESGMIAQRCHCN